MKKLLLLTLLTIGFGGISLPHAAAQSFNRTHKSIVKQNQLPDFKFLKNPDSPYQFSSTNNGVSLDSNTQYRLSPADLFKSANPFPSRINYSTRPNENLSNSDINWTTFSLTSAGIAGFYTTLFSREQNRRWGGPKVPFYTNSKLEAKGFDKFGHFYATKTQAAFISNLYNFSNIKTSTSALLGAGIALSVQSIIEIKDGRVTSGGFDAYDQTANVLGASWFYSREQVDFLQRFNVRWFYYPSDEKDLLEPNTRFNEDYSGHTYWLSMQSHDLLSEKLQRYWPKFLVPAAGISLNNWTGIDNPDHYYSYHLSIAPDFRHIIPQHSRIGRFFTDILNGFYVPAPAVEVYPDFGFKLIFYGQN